MDKVLFITGLGRSGTTLLDKIFGGFQEVDSFSQPLPLLLVQLKASFLHSFGIDDHFLNYPLTDQQFENSYDLKSFVHFLKNVELSKDYLSPILRDMSTYSGQTFKPIDTFASLNNRSGHSLEAFAKHYFFTHQAVNTNSFVLTAWKETFAEEFIPYFTNSGFHSLLVIRDPRDVLTSMLGINGKKYSGQPRPLLWLARQWRKSVAYKHQYENKDEVKFVKYEDLVNEPNVFMKEWAKWIGIKPQKELAILKDKNGQIWSGNSSFSTHTEISTKSVGQHIEFLNKPLTRFLEALCYVEMKAMGYQPSISIDEVESLIISGPREDFLEREVLSHYAYSEKRMIEELNRWHALSSNEQFNPSQFIFKRNFDKIRKVIKT